MCTMRSCQHPAQLCSYLGKWSYLCSLFGYRLPFLPVASRNNLLLASKYSSIWLNDMVRMVLDLWFVGLIRLSDAPSSQNGLDQ
jgi:predicted Kef-type K+ transport protein